MYSHHFVTISTISSNVSNRCSYSKNTHESGTTALITSNEEMEDIRKIVKSLQESGLLMQGITKAIKNKTKEQKDGFLSMLLGVLAASILRNALVERGVIRVGEITITAGEGIIREVIRLGEGTITADKNF